MLSPDKGDHRPYDLFPPSETLNGIIGLRFDRVKPGRRRWASERCDIGLFEKLTHDDENGDDVPNVGLGSEKLVPAPKGLIG